MASTWSSGPARCSASRACAYDTLAATVGSNSDGTTATERPSAGGHAVIAWRGRYAQAGVWVGRPYQGRIGFRIDTKREYGTARSLRTEYPEAIATGGFRLFGVLIENRPAIDVMRQYDAPTTARCRPTLSAFYPGAAL